MSEKRSWAPLWRTKSKLIRDGTTGIRYACAMQINDQAQHRDISSLLLLSLQAVLSVDEVMLLCWAWRWICWAHCFAIMTLQPAIEMLLVGKSGAHGHLVATLAMIEPKILVSLWNGNRLPRSYLWTHSNPVDVDRRAFLYG